MISTSREVKVPRKRRYGLEIWGLGLGYYLFYTPYSGLTKALSSGVLSVGGRPVSGAVLLPITAITTMVGMLAFITSMKWWNYASRRKFFGISVPFPRRATCFSGVCMAIIMGTTTLAFSFSGLSIVLVLVLLRGGILTIGPLVDAIVGRRARWFSWAAMLVSLAAVMIALADVKTYKLTLVAIIDIAAYLAAYFFKLQIMSRLAKCEDRSTTLRYFVEEQMVAAPLLVLVVVTMGLIGSGSVMQGFRVGLTTFLAGSGAMWAAAAGFCYAGLCICTTLIFLDRRENTFCIPMHCGSSMLAGFTATACLSYFLGQTSLSSAQTTSAGLMFIALGFLSPLHHFDRVLAKLKRAFARQTPEWAGLPPDAKLSTSSDVIVKPALGQRLILFVCSGNTCRSPMAATIANAEIATRLKIPLDEIDGAQVKATSAGVSAIVGAPMTTEAKQALRQLGFHPNGHRARSLTVELASQAEKIFCMTQAQRDAVVALVPLATDKTGCLDTNGDIADPMGAGFESYLHCARNIRRMVRTRVDELGLSGQPD
jgi:protein-tyrosine-phosphatase